MLLSILELDEARKQPALAELYKRMKKRYVFDKMPKSFKVATLSGPGARKSRVFEVVDRVTTGRFAYDPLNQNTIGFEYRSDLNAFLTVWNLTR
jgi:hypothetical protein